MGKTVLMQGNEACVEGALAACMILFPICAVLFRQLWDHSGLQNS